MTQEPFNIVGKTIKDSFFINDNQALRIEFTDGTSVIIEGFWMINAYDKVELEKLTIKTGI